MRPSALSERRYLELRGRRHRIGLIIIAVEITVVIAGTLLLSWSFSGGLLFGRYEFVPVIVVGMAMFVAAIIYSRIVYGANQQAPLRDLGALPARVWVLVIVVLIFGTASTSLSRPRGDAVSRSPYSGSVVGTDRMVLGFAIVFSCLAAVTVAGPVVARRRLAELAASGRALSRTDTLNVIARVLLPDSPRQRNGFPSFTLTDLTISAHGIRAVHRSRAPFPFGAGQLSRNQTTPIWSTAWDDIATAYRLGPTSIVITKTHDRWIQIMTMSPETADRTSVFLALGGRPTTATKPHD